MRKIKSKPPAEELPEKPEPEMPEEPETSEAIEPEVSKKPEKPSRGSGRPAPASIGRKHMPPPPLHPWKHASFSMTGKGEVVSDLDEKVEESAIEEGLETIYLKDAAKDDLTTFHAVKHNRFLRVALWVLGSLFVTSVFAWVGLLYFQPFAGEEGPGLVLEIAGPGQIALGREETYVLRWSNRSFQPVTDASVRLNMPPEFTATSFEPALAVATATKWDLGIVAPGEQGRITVKGIFLGEVGQTSGVQAIGVYRELGKEGSSDALAALPVTYETSLLMGALELPVNVIAGETVDIRYVLTNTGEQNIDGLLARFILPAGFILGATTSAPFTQSDGGYEQVVPALAPHATTTVVLSGSFASGSSGEQALEAKVGVRSSAGAFVAMHTDTKTLPVLAGDLNLQLVVNGATESRLHSPRDPLRISLAYENVSPEPLSGVSIQLSFESLKDGVSATGTTWLDWKRLEDVTGAVSSTRTRIQTLRYDATSVPELAEIAPQGKGTFDLLIPTFGITTTTRDARIVIRLEGAVAKVGKNVTGRTIRTQPMELRYRTDAALSAHAIYFTEEGAPVGSGPLPPQAGTTTVYRVVWHVGKTLHELSDGVVTAVLPSIAHWGDVFLATAGDITYDAESRTARWNIGTIPFDANDVEATFDVRVTPTDLDVGRFAAILGETGFTAKDVDTGEPIAMSKPPLTSDLQEDEGARGKGVVRKP